MPVHLLKTAAGLLPVLALGGCALAPHFEPPRLSVVGVQVVSSELWEQRLKVRLRVQNPNDVALAVKGIDYTFDVTGQRERAINEYNLAIRTKDDTNGAQAEAARYLKTPYQK